MAKIFMDFDEIEQEVREKVPPVVYKYRDWANPYHQGILTEGSIWMAHPKELNDPYDIRVPVRFDFSEVNHPAFFERLKFHGQSRMPFLQPDSRDFRVICENQLEIIKQNPKEYFEKNFMDMRESDLWDRIGVFSATEDCLNETMWAHYGNNSRGFVVGFDTVGMARDLSGFGFVDYSDIPPLHSFVKPVEENQKDQMYLKHTKWAYEKEFRFITFRMRSDRDRAIKINTDHVKEVVVGDKIPKEHLEQIIEVLRNTYHSTVSVFQIVHLPSSYGFTRTEIKY